MQSPADDDIPLVVDMDDTLLATDSLLEGFYAALRADSLAVMRLPFRLLQGRLSIKQALLDSPAHVARYPLNQETAEHLRKEAAAGRRIFLATAALQETADLVAARLGCFAGVFASGEGVNLKGAVKAQALEKRFGALGFDYMADAPCDMAVWKIARKAIVVNNPRLARKVAEKTGRETLALGRSMEPPLKSVFGEMRVRQWVKNLLVFVPLLLEHDFLTPPPPFKIFSAAFSRRSSCALSRFYRSLFARRRSM